MNKAKAQETPVTELFKQFCKERHAEDKGKNYDMLQEVYANTELFDLSFLDKTTPNFDMFDNEKREYKDNTLSSISFKHDFFKNLSLPFESQFIKIGNANRDEVTIFLREYTPFTITGTTYIISEGYSLNSPFVIGTIEGTMTLNLKSIYDYAYALRNIGHKEDKVQDLVELVLSIILGQIAFSINAVCNLPKHSVATDRPKHAEYYTRKHSSTIKVVKPIYYVLDKSEEKTHNKYNRIKPVGSIAFDHSFKVRGHWRTIDSKTYGKNRQGEYIVKGMTWVKEHVRGEGDLIKKIRVIK